MNIPYYELYRMHADRYLLRQKIVAHARQQGVKATTRGSGQELMNNLATAVNRFSDIVAKLASSAS